MNGPDARQRPSARRIVGLALVVALVVAAGAALLAWRGSPRAQQVAVPASNATIGAHLSGRVVLNEALQSRVKPDDTVLIVARLLDGPLMPVATQKRRASELPFDFKLDESAATTPTLRLSPSMQLVVAVRVLRAGQAAAEPGDLIGTSQPGPVGSHGLVIEINHRAP